METNELRMAEPLKNWQGNYESRDVKTITFCVTEDCNLECKYCYMTGKNNKKRMSFEVAKKSIDYILSNRDEFYEKSVVWDFIGGEPFLEIDLIDKICDYIKLKMFIMDHPWFDSYRFSFSTNGLLYSTLKVQKFIEKNKTHTSIGISVDGNKIKHDLQRVYPDGRGSYDDVMQNVDLWQQQFKNGNTKATFSHSDLPYLKESIISLWENGIKSVAANVVFEDVWQEGDDRILEEQLDSLGEYILENKLWNEYHVRFFDPIIGNPIKEEDKKHNFCGSGKMLAIGCDGTFYPCIRFLDFSLEKRKGRAIGNINDGIERNKLRAFKCLTLENQSKQECLDCEVATGCALCTGFNYDDTGSIFQRATYICKLHKATVRANKRFWAKYENLTGNLSPRKDYENVKNKRYLQIMLDDDITPHCNYRNWNNTKNVMTDEMINNALEFSINNDLEPVFLGNTSRLSDNIASKYISIESARQSVLKNSNLVIPIYDNNIESLNMNTNNCIILINKKNVSNIETLTKALTIQNERVNIKLENIDEWNSDTLNLYSKELDKLIELVEETYVNKKPLEVNILTDRLYNTEHCDCSAGVKTFTLAPNGDLYNCPAFYYSNPEESIGSIKEGINNKFEKLMKIQNSPICKYCDAYQCNACKFLNKKLTEEYNIPSKIQCEISILERNKSKKLQSNLIMKGLIANKNIINDIDYLDPIENLIRIQENAR